MKTKHIATLATAVLLAACGETETTVETPAAAAAPSAALTTVLDASVIGEPLAIHAVRESAKPGDSVVLRGRVMGSLHPFVDGRAAFILGDSEVLTACSDRPGDECETPWDVCCDSSEDKKRGTATIQIVDADGRVLKEAVEGVGGVAKLARLTVSGTVAESSSSEALIIEANAIDVVE